jgi:oxygen-independent coproporphyrinogen-3 oxidase
LNKLFAMLDANLLQKYNVQVPRYTSYPTVPAWEEHIEVKNWEGAFQRDFLDSNQQKGISLYIHLPFCESLCTYCGCNKKITNQSWRGDGVCGCHTGRVAAVPGTDDRKTNYPRIAPAVSGPLAFSPGNLDKLLTGIFNTATLYIPTTNSVLKVAEQYDKGTPPEVVRPWFPPGELWCAG